MDYAGQWKIGKSTTKGIQKLEMAVQTVISKINKSILYGRMKSRVRTDYWMDFSYTVLGTHSATGSPTHFLSL